MEFGNKWVEKEISKELREETNEKLKNYFCWQLRSKEQRYAHVFLCELENQNELELQWRNIVNQIAVYVQSETESLLERSNFYVWFFVNGKVMRSLQKSIEDDAYSSKKFVVVEEEKKSLNERLEEIEKRLFVFDFDLKKSTKQMIAKVEMQNFRTYKGKKTFEFSTEEEIARLVVLFAPNGMGKTSFFDGVEWNLTGGVDRFNELGKKKSFMGEVVLRNKEADNSENSSVSLYLDDGGNIERKVSKLNGKTKRDTGKGIIVSMSVQEEVEKYIGKDEPWKNLILQHHKIDGFIAAKSPQDLYKEWGSLWDAGGEKRAEFEDSYKKSRHAEKVFEEVKKEYDELNKKYNELDRGRKFAEEIFEYVQKFQKESGSDKLSNVDFKTMSAEDYAKWSDLVEQEIFFYQTEQEKNENKLLYIQNDFQKDIEQYCSILETSQQQKKKERLVEQELQKCHEKKMLLLREQETEEQKRKLEEQIEPYCFIKERSKVWYVEGSKYFKTIEERREAEEALKEVEEESLPLLENEVKSLQLQYVQACEKLEDQSEYKNLYNHMKKIDELRKEEGELNKKIQKSLEDLSLYNGKLKEAKEGIEKIRRKKLGTIDQVLAVYMKEGGTISESTPDLEDKRKKLVEHLKSYLSCKDEINETDYNISVEEKLEEEIRSIVMDAREIITNQKLKKCPICNTEYQNYQELLEKTCHTESVKGEALKEERKRLVCKLEEIESQIEFTIQEYNNVLKGEMAQKQEQQMKIVDDSLQIEKQQNEILNQIEEKQNQIDYIQKKDQQQGIYVVYTVEGIENWKSLWITQKRTEVLQVQTKLEKTTEQLEKYHNKQKKLQEELKKMEQFLEDYEQEAGDSIGTVKHLQKIIESQSYEEIEKKFLELEREKNEIKILQEDLREKLKYYQDIIVSGEENYKEELNDLHMKIKALSGEAQETKIHIQNIIPEVTVDNIEKYCKKEEITLKEQYFNAKIKHISDILEILSLLKYNNEVKSYFSDWKQFMEELRMKFKEYEEKECEKNELNAKYDKAKLDIQSEMQEFLKEFQVNDIYRKLEPHDELKDLVSEFDFTDDGKPELEFHVADESGKTYPPEWYFSTAQLNAVAFSIFLGRALQARDVPIKSILIDDPIGHFDDMNIVGFVDLLRNILENTDRQLIISTHEERVFGLIQRKIPKDEYPVKYIDFRKI